MKSSKGWVKYVSASLAVAIVALPFASVGAQQSPGDAPTPVIRIKTRLVTVDVVVTDKWGKPVAGLHPEDFAVEENGRKQKVVVFATPEEANKPEAPMPTLGPGIYTNRPEFRVTGGPPTVLLLDAANTAFKDQAYARLQMLKYVQDATAGRRIAIFTLTNGLHMLQDFTSDPKALQDILQHYKPQEQEMGKTPAAPLSTLAGGDGGTRDASAGAIAMAQSIRGFQDEQVGYVLDRRVQTTLEAMRSLARILGGIPGRKNIIWLTAAFPFSLIPEDRAVSQAELDPYMQGTKQVGLSARAASATAGAERGFHADAIRDASAQLASAQVAIYPVDVRGLMSGAEANFDDLANRQTFDLSAKASIRMSDVTASQDTMREIAEETGGKAYVNQNEIKDGVTLALADNAASYTIGYYPEDKKWNGKYRNIKVKVAHDGVQVRHRKGYYAIDPAELKDRKPDQETAEALRGTIPATQVTFSAQVKRGDKESPSKLHVNFLVDARTLSAEDATNGKHVNATFYAAIFSPDGKLLSNKSMKVDKVFDDATYQQILQHGILMPMDVDAPAGKNELRLLVRDERTGYVGTTIGTISE